MGDLNQDLQSFVAAISEERDRLAVKLAYAESTIRELVRQNKEQSSMLAEAQALLVMNGMATNPKTAKVSSPNSNSNQSKVEWIGGIWPSNAANKTILRPAEVAWQSGKSQQALELLTKLLTADLSAADEIEVHLLLSAVLLTSNQVGKAFKHANIALRRAKHNDLDDAIGTSQFYVGLCFYHMNRYANASWCFVLASYTPGYKEKAEENWQASERELMKISPDDPEKYQLATP